MDHASTFLYSKRKCSRIKVLHSEILFKLTEVSRHWVNMTLDLIKFFKYMPVKDILAPIYLRRYCLTGLREI